MGHTQSKNTKIRKSMIEVIELYVQLYMSAKVVVVKLYMAVTVYPRIDE